ncbi:Gfo/Idh/MocA family oxidoreductase [Streptomyces sp. MB09-01]|uniref:Gfo/Idh/MocA family protein n=1 Tax=Streptomyces sp. MB09-01 TaxID=3028666 RepID=UPI0029B77EED|nr:Gfo/Idh/MocA family oxidoreductase [Streptomyces sp. MB09-01]MDX3538449.1 Gfo/Idh/MocA family oxidoreductase [Streptomyces sp. MB09-01]
MTDTVRIGVLGCADIAVRRMLPAFAAHPGTVVTAVASRDPAKARRTAERFGCAPVTGYAELLAHGGVDAVYLPLPAALHADWTEAALAAGKHVLVEKPAAPDAATAARLCDLARAAGLALVENVMFVHHPRHAAVHKLLADGAIGELRSFQAVFTIPAPPDRDIRYDPELGGGALADIGLYPVRAALHLLGDGLETVGAHLAAGPGRRVETTGAALLRTRDDVVAQLEFGMAHAYRSEYRLRGSDGEIHVDRAFTPPADHVPEIAVHRGGRTERIRLAPFDQVAAAVDAFVTAVRERAAPDPAVVGQAALLDAVRRSAARR